MFIYRSFVKPWKTQILWCCIISWFVRGGGSGILLQRESNNFQGHILCNPNGNSEHRLQISPAQAWRKWRRSVQKHKEGNCPPMARTEQCNHEKYAGLNSVGPRKAGLGPLPKSPWFQYSLVSVRHCALDCAKSPVFSNAHSKVAAKHCAMFSPIH